MEKEAQPANKTLLGGKQDAWTARGGIFKETGDFWTLAYGEKSIHLKDCRGLRYIVHLLRSPGLEFHVFDLLEGNPTRAGSGKASQMFTATKTNTWTRHEARLLNRRDLGDAGELLDEKAIAAYKTRLTDLRAQREEAIDSEDPARAERIEQEINVLAKELSRGVGVGGRRRRAASASERARVQIRKAIKFAVDRIADKHSPLASLLSRTITTGNFCSYNPGSTEIVDWDFGAATSINISDGESEGTIAAPEDITSPRHIARSDSSMAGGNHRASFVGRENEKREIMSAFQETLSGRGSLLAIVGPPGIGKTRLARECAQDASTTCGFVLHGHCYEAHQAHPFLPFVEMLQMALSRAQSFESFRRALGDNAAELAQLDPGLRRIFRDIPPAIELPSAQARRYLFDSLCDFLARLANSKPLFLIVDDLQWGDESTLSFLTHLLRRLGNSSTMVIATYRDTEAAGNAHFLATLEELIREGIRTIRLDGLPRASVSTLIGTLSGRSPSTDLVDSIYYETSGNPFFVEELFKMLVEEGRLFEEAGTLRTNLEPHGLGVPQNIKVLTARRLTRLDPETQRSLAAAAIIGHSFSFKLLDSILECGSDALLDAIDEARGAGLIVASSEKEAPLAFAHEIVRQAILASLSLPREQRLHTRIAIALQSADPAELANRAAEIVQHLLQSGSDAVSEEIENLSRIAGRRAMEAAAYGDALQHFECALKHQSLTESADKANLLYEIGMAKQSLGRWEDALSDWQHSVELFAHIGDSLAAGSVAASIVETLAWTGQYIEAAQIAYRGLDYLGGNRTANRARLLAAIGMIHSAAGSFESARDVLMEALELAEDMRDEKTLGVALSYMTLNGYAFLRMEEAIAHGRRSAQLLRGNGAVWSLAQLLGFLQISLLHAGKISEAFALRNELDSLAAKIGHSAALMLSGRVRAWGEFSRSNDLKILSKELLRDLELVTAAKLPWIAGSYAQLAVMEFYAGNWDLALKHARKGYELEFPSAFNGFATGALIRQYAYLGDAHEALGLLEQQRIYLPRLNAPNTLGSSALLVQSIEALFVLGERAKAWELYPLAVQLSDTGIVAIAEIAQFPHTAAALAATAGRKWEIAEHHFRTALQQAEALPHLLEQIEIKRFYAQMLLERSGDGDQIKAGNFLIAAETGYEGAAMPKHLALTRSLSIPK